MDADTLQSMRKLVEDHLHPRVVETKPGAVLVVPQEFAVHDLEAFVEKHAAVPRRPKGASTHHTLASLIAHARRHRTAASVAFCDALDARPSLTAVYDYHPAAEGNGAGGWKEHRAIYAFPLAEPWVRWTGAAGKSLTVAQFAELLEAGIADVRDVAADADVPRLPGVRYATPAELLTLAEGLAVRVEQQVVEQRRLDNGTGQLLFAEAHDTRNTKGDAIKVPNGFLLGIPVFVGGPAYAIPVRLRYRVASGAVTWTLALHDAETAKREAVTEAAAQFAEQTALPLFHGAAE